MIKLHDGVSFNILGQTIHLYSDLINNSMRNTVADMGSYFHYLGPEFPGISAAIFAWQETHGRELTDIELKQILDDNQLDASNKSTFQI